MTEQAANTTVQIPYPDDWHVHLRDDEMLSAVIDYSARRYRYAMVMPNLRPPVATTAAALAYRARIIERVPPGSLFTPLMALFVSPEMDLADVRAGHKAGVVTAVKYYPPGATTNSDQAKGTLNQYGELFQLLTDLDMRLLVHAESTDPTVDIFAREAAFLERQLAPVCAEFPNLPVTLEHVSTRAGIEFVDAHSQVVASITPHHLARERSDLLAHGMEPDLFCKPVINSADDRDALVAAATSGSGSFFMGTDSAPHPTTAKYRPKAAAGIFNAPYGLEVVAEVFHQQNALAHLAGFVSENGARVYGFPVSQQLVDLTRHSGEQSEPEPELLTTESGEQVVFFGVEEGARWTTALA